MSRRAFTLIELLVVIAIIGLLSTVAVVATSGAQMNARNARRRDDLIAITKALELYYADNGQYPTTTNQFRAHCGYGNYPDTDPGSWIPGLVSGGYMSKLPDDPRCGKANPNSADNGCWSRTNNSYIYISDGKNYGLMAYCTPEGTLSSNDPFYEPNNPQRTWELCSDKSICNANNWW